MRVHEELAASGAAFSYQALTAFCRREGIGQTPIVPAGRYEFSPGEETQHDTSPHEVIVGGRKFKAQTASATLCYSRILFFQLLPTFQRFDCKVFLTDAVRYMNGATQRVMIDNTHVVVSKPGRTLAGVHGSRGDRAVDRRARGVAQRRAGAHVRGLRAGRWRNFQRPCANVGVGGQAFACAGVH
ncbi:MAG: hypothetical protein NTY38_32970 [Acidobacteria bacterium]|nr:hypothetical protein [Acidobacteriota bacterium]